ncbi:MAG: hypothetical protein M0036_04955 [Desulfobacteraceae bacterium]|nr:hypothetical protein [Desulfobacteraceae bacterium]
MSDATIRAAIKARLDELGAPIGRVHDYERWNVNAGNFLALFQDQSTKKIFGWEISRTGFKTERAAMNKLRLIHRYTIRGYYGLEDAVGTEKSVNALADAIAADLAQTRLTGTERDLMPEANISTRMFGQVLCHVVEIVLPEVVEIISPAETPAPDLTGIDIEYYLTPSQDTATDAEDRIELRWSDHMVYDDAGEALMDEEGGRIKAQG